MKKVHILIGFNRKVPSKGGYPNYLGVFKSQKAAESMMKIFKNNDSEANEEWEYILIDENVHPDSYVKAIKARHNG